MGNCKGGEGMEERKISSLAGELMLEYARLTGLEPVVAPPRRYLWTDAFAVCNYLELFRRTNDEALRDLGLRLIGQVHQTLGRHRDDDPRTGWISGLPEEEGVLHPTRGGLRIGKPLNERKAGEPPDERLEWDQDGQYYHYLTKWMHALNRAGRVTGNPVYLRWAAELAEAAHAGFTYTSPSGERRGMYWKMSIDLSRPLVPSMGLHDPLDGFVTYRELQMASGDYGQQAFPDLTAEVADMGDICQGTGGWATDDPLGIGGLLFDASRIAQLMIRGGFQETGLLETVMSAALLGLASFARGNSLQYPAAYRLAFRELGLAIGLSAVEGLQDLIKAYPDLFGENPLQQVNDLMAYVPIGETIRRFWTDGRNRETDNWTGHREINMVMLATSLAPDSFLQI
jgi:hypothetical protein